MSNSIRKSIKVNIDFAKIIITLGEGGKGEPLTDSGILTCQAFISQNSL